MAKKAALKDANVAENDTPDKSEERGSLAVPLLGSSSTSEPRAQQEALAAPLHVERRDSDLRRRCSPTANSELRDGQPRILDRAGTFCQSRGRWGVQRLSHGMRSRTDGTRQRVRGIWDDWFHSLASKPTLALMSILFLIYALIVFFFAFVYLGVSKLGSPIDTDTDTGGSHTFCNMEINNHMEALFFSLSTMTTIGYGVSDYYFGDCWTPLLLVLWQSCVAITFSAVAIGLLFQRISRGQKRSKTILFSDRAIVRRIRGISYLMFRVGELRRHHLIEASVRAYCLRHERLPLDTHSENERPNIETTHFLARHVALLHPDESVGSHILMSLPQVIVHRLDKKSPLVPSDPIWYDADGRSHATSGISTQHDDMRSFLSDREAEIIVLVEGVDELTGAALQARHSYRVEDIAWDCTLAPCVFPCVPEGRDDEPRNWFQRTFCDSRSTRSTPACTVDFAKFHDVIPVPQDSQVCAYVPR